MVFLGKPDVFGAIQDKLVVPEDLQNYLRTKAIYIDDRPLHWPMFRFSAWSELEMSSRKNYTRSARTALVRAGYESTDDQKRNFEKFMFYKPELDKDYVKPKEEQDMNEAVIVAQELNTAGNPPTAPKAKAPPKARPKAVFTQNPIRIVEFMIAVDMDPWEVVRSTWETTQANGFASGLASCTYSYLRLLYEKGLYKNDALFRRVLSWSFIFSRYTTVARKDTGDRHQSQLNTKEKDENTEKWPVWKDAVLERLSHFFNIDGNIATIKASVKPKLNYPYGPRPTSQILDDTGGNNVYVPKASKLPPWKRDTYSNDPRPPNFRELRDCALLACYSLIAPIRLDWATVEVMDEKGFQAFKKSRDEALMPADQDEEDDGDIHRKDKKKKELDKNVIVVDSKTKPTVLTSAYFTKMKNKAKFKNQLPLEKKIREESPLCANVLLAYLQWRAQNGMTSKCLFPANLTPMSEELAPSDCFTNGAFGKLLADMAWDLTKKNFTETLMRRSFITWFWEQPGNDPLNLAVHNKLLPMVHQTSSTANLGYIKKRNEDLERWKDEHKGYKPHELAEEVRRLRDQVLLDTGQSTNPEDDELEVEERKEAQKEVENAQKEVKQLQLRLSSRLQEQDKEEGKVEEAIENEKEVEEQIKDIHVPGLVAKPQPAPAKKERKVQAPPAPAPQPPPPAPAPPAPQPPKAKAKAKAKPEPKAKAKPEPKETKTRSGRAVKNPYLRYG
jgi:hypothetical protein